MGLVVPHQFVSSDGWRHSSTAPRDKTPFVSIVAALHSDGEMYNPAFRRYDGSQLQGLDRTRKRWENHSCDESRLYWIPLPEPQEETD